MYTSCALYQSFELELQSCDIRDERLLCDCYNVPMSDFTGDVYVTIYYIKIVIFIGKVTAKVENTRYEKNLNDVLIINTICLTDKWRFFCIYLNPERLVYVQDRPSADLHNTCNTRVYPHINIVYI